MERAEKLYQRAIEADPTHANIIGNFAAFVHYERKEMERAEQLYERAIDIGPTEASIICNFAILMETERNDLDRAEKLFTRAIDIAPQRADIIGRFANFLAKARKEAQRAEEMYMRAIGADPTSAINIGNRAGFELSREVSPESLALLRIASGMSNDSDDLALELCFYHFAHGEKKERSLWLAKAKQLIAAGIRSPGWDFGPNIERAIKDGHPTRAWLKKLAAVINGDSPPDVLNTWKAWQQIPSS
jgi:tetratricopeptide (TPR) repeat protein